MRKEFVLCLVIVMVMVAFVGVQPAQAKNLEMLDELKFGAKVQSQDLILKSEHIDIGAEIGVKDLTNSDTAKNTFYAMGTVTIKGFSIFNW